MSLLKAFLAAFALGAGAIVVMANLPDSTVAPPQTVAPPTAPAVLSPTIHVRDQLQLADLAQIRAKGYRTLIDLRPDGEAKDQPPSSAVAEAAAKAGLKFAYVPTPNGNIPDSVVADLTRALTGAEGQVLLYCRSGNRAARVWALAEASRPGGSDASTIIGAVKTAGQKVEDLVPRITARIAARASQ